ncbi:MAG: DinB family protein [Acidobacteriota bacterium]|nr:DinB family protein [Acidobacteriota bacterium]
MSIAQDMLKEFEHQAPITRGFLERLPEDKLTWKPHEKSMSAGMLAYHLATVPGALMKAVAQSSVPAPDFKFPEPKNKEEILAVFDESVETVRAELPKFDDAAMHETWRLMNGDQVVLAQERGLFLRDVLFSHLYQHRGQFSVYLRMLNVAVPASFGPSADEPPMFMQNEMAA